MIGCVEKCVRDERRFGSGLRSDDSDTPLLWRRFLTWACATVGAQPNRAESVPVAGGFVLPRSSARECR